MDSASTREVTWGEGLVVAAFKYGGGLRKATTRIQGVVGSHIGTRNTFAKLLHVSSTVELKERDLFRAWLLVATFGEEPGEWGIPDAVVPDGYDIAHLRAALRDPASDPLKQPGGREAWSGDHEDTQAYLSGHTVTPLFRHASEEAA